MLLSPVIDTYIQQRNSDRQLEYQELEKEKVRLDVFDQFQRNIHGVQVRITVSSQG